MNYKVKIIIFLLLVGAVLLIIFLSKSDRSEEQQQSQTTQQPNQDLAQQPNSFEFTKLNPLFRFSAQLPSNVTAEYVPQIESISINNKEEPQIFIRYFTGNEFLTLSTVDILSRKPTEIKGHAAIEYEIKKKPNIADFPFQPSWRNEQHKLIDIRLTNNDPSIFYVFAYNPKLSEATFREFIDSLVFHNDKQSLVQPIRQAERRVTKKPFGLYVEPGQSPVAPERFKGFHNAVDYEILAGEEKKNVEIFAICGGFLREKKTAQGYGGVLIQDCLIQDQPVTVIYGHIKLGSVTKQAEDYIIPGEKIALLGDADSSETDGERKHLHLGIKKGLSSDIRGYVQSETELDDWIDFTALIE
ncbi:MAG: peptidoglycan DD-metalloendopeptidase family protein [Candidatus Doudnabacteria bacterium]|nr:peptidoglycan DD-metalloendopeptidase family protein [Candidatus Doudnabacteria bacterium]